ncbi:MAG: trypsin-like peptidase domain-containing protein [Eubacteriales bacterium]|nr:trypsin-like peptidase domain-containing protein [Eubacteriales bacterium]
MSDEMRWGESSLDPAGTGEHPQEITQSRPEQIDSVQAAESHELEELKGADIPWLNEIPKMNRKARENQADFMSQMPRQSGTEHPEAGVQQEQAAQQEAGHHQNENPASSSEPHQRSNSGTENSGRNHEGSIAGQGGGSGNGPIPPKYAHYEMHQGRRPGISQPPQKQKNSGGFFGKLAAVVALAAVFGLVAGLVFQGVNLMTGKYIGTARSVSVGTTESVPVQEIDSEETSSGDVDIKTLVAESGTVAGVAQAAMPSVVAITSVSIQEIPSFFSYYGFGYGGTQEYPSTGSGSGIIVGENDNELLIATNNHVVEGATTLSVCFIGNDVVGAEEETQSMASGDGDINVENAVSAKIKGTDPDNDLAVVAVQKSDVPAETMSEIKIAQIGSSDNLVVGEQVVAIGNALGYGQSVTSGWISAMNRTVTLEDGSNSDLIQTDAAINPGNSGGALLNMRGELIGINSAKYADNAVEGMGYAIPISKAQPILEELMNRRTREKVEDSKAAYLGVNVANLSTEAIEMYNMPAGAFVTEVFSGSAAEAAGIQKSDIVVKLDGQKVSGRDDLIEKLTYYEAAEEVEIVVARADNGEYVENTFMVTLGARPDSK